MIALNRQQALVTLGIISLSLTMQIAMLSSPLMLLGFVLLLLVWRQWLALWKISKAIKLVAILSVLLLLAAQYGGFLSLEPMVGLLAFSVLLKLFEANSRRDVYLLILLSLFGLATPLLFTQSLLMFAIVLLAGFIHLGGLTYLHGGRAPKAILKTAWNVVMLSVPLALVLFFIVPRLPPLWAVPMAKPTARTGLSDQMALGDIASLSRDTSLAFQASFEGDLPPPSARYWRSMMLVDYDGVTWRPMPVRQNVVKNTPKNLASDYRYDVLMQASGSPWMAILGRASSWPSSVFALKDGTVQSKKNIFTKQLFPIVSQASLLADPAEMDSDFGEEYLRLNRFLPSFSHPRTRALARELGRGLQGPEQLQRLLAFFNQQEFYYTLSPGVLLGDKIDSFMFESRKGFCEHYAAAFAVMARELGYPARIATGYLGGEASTIAENTLSVYQYDAHAWVEVWLPGEGWRQFDPTAWVNPARVDQSSLALDAWRESELSGVEQWMWIMRSQAMVMQARHYAEWVNLRWVQFMLNYDSSGQLQFLQAWLGDISVWKMLALLFSALSVWVVYGALASFYSYRKQDQVVMVYRQLLEVLKASPASTPNQLAHLIESKGVSAKDIKTLENYWFGSETVDRVVLLKALKKVVGRLKKSPAD